MSWRLHYVDESQRERLQLLAAGALTARRSAPYALCFDCEAGDRRRDERAPAEPR